MLAISEKFLKSLAKEKSTSNLNCPFYFAPFFEYIHTNSIYTHLLNAKTILKTFLADLTRPLGEFEDKICRCLNKCQNFCGSISNMIAYVWSSYGPNNIDGDGCSLTHRLAPTYLK